MPKEVFIESTTFIGAWVLEDPSLCDDLIFHFEENDRKCQGKINHLGEQIIRKDLKDSVDVLLDHKETITQRYIAELTKIKDQYLLKYPYAKETGRWDIEGINVQKYNPGGGYKTWHTERSEGCYPNVYRHLVFMTYLNTIDGGGTEFYHQNIKIQPKKGLTLIWPADWTHTHRGIVCHTEVKYIATGWYSFLKHPTDNLPDSFLERQSLVK